MPVGRPGAYRYRGSIFSNPFAPGESFSGAQTLRERIVAKDLEGAKKAWIASRVGWERSEVFTSGSTSELDAAIDAWPSAVKILNALADPVSPELLLT